jgi:hypothetical protein
LFFSNLHKYDPLLYSLLTYAFQKVRFVASQPLLGGRVAASGNHKTRPVLGTSLEKIREVCAKHNMTAVQAAFRWLAVHSVGTLLYTRILIFDISLSL